jgi:ABC-type multidrug transport system ATPase subunit
MSESILNALVHLFAIITNFTDSRVSEKARQIVYSYLKKQLSLSQAIEYLQVFDEYLSYYNVDNTKVDSEKGRKRGTLSSVRVLKICQQINENLHQRDKFIVLLRLIEFVNEDGIITETELDFVSTVAESFNIAEKEFAQIKALITNQIDEITEKDSVLIIDKAEPGADWDGEWFDKNKPEHIKDYKHISNENLDGRILVLNIKSSDLYFFAYFGKSVLYLQGHNVIPGTGYILDHGSIIKGPKISPLYYSDIVAKFLAGPTRDKITFTADNISFRFKGSNNGIQPFSFTEDSGNLIGIMGGSGVGKSTLLNVLNGKLPLHSGNITINGYDIHREKDYLEGVIGYVPQDDLLIEELTVFQNLYFNANLCFSNFNKDQILQTVDKILIDLDLLAIKDLKVGNPLEKYISGGQRKRLNIGLELMREPSVLFVDEPTSGLSSTDSEMVMLLLRQQASKGKLVIVNIHQPSSDIYKLLDKLWVMDKHGYIIFTGNPIDAVVYFKRITEHVNAEESECITCGNVNSEQIMEIVESKVVDEYGRFTRIRKRNPDDWFRIFHEQEISKVRLKKEKEKLPSNFFKIPSIERQFQIFAHRNILSKLSNKQYLLINLLEMPLLAFILAFFTKHMVNGEYVFAENKNLPVYLFMCVVVSIFVGLTVSAQEIIRDKHILERESFLNLSYFSFINSKIVVLFAMSAIQVISFVLIGNWILEIKGLTFSYWILLFSTAAFSNLLGLNISSSFNSIVNIYIIIPFILVPQILLGGAMVNFDDLHDSMTSKKYVPLIGDIMISRWAYEALAVEQYSNNRFERHYFEYDKEKSRQQFKSAFIISELKRRLLLCESELQKSDKSVFNAQILLVKNEINAFANDPALKNIRKPDLDKFNSNAGIKEIGAANEYLDTIKLVFERLAMVANEKREEKYNQMLKNIGSQEMFKLQNDYYNKALEDIVMNKMQLKKIVEIDGRLIPKKDPIFMKPESRYGRAQFYFPEKNIFGYEVNTFIFNILVIWLGAFLLYIALLRSWLKKVFRYCENLANKKKALKTNNLP